MNFFTMAVNESTSGSLFYLGSIFGPVGTVLPGTGPALLGTMFKVFNTAVLAIGTVIITYTAAMSIIMTAHEGEMLGKKFHNLWIPLRTIAGIAALVPSATGYSYLQMGMMWFIIQGVGAADTLWSTTVNYINSGAAIQPPTPGSTVVPITIKVRIGELFQGLVCQAAQKASCTADSEDPWCTQTDAEMLMIKPASLVYKMGGPAGKCGALKLGDAADPTGIAQNNAYQLIIPSLGTIAAQYVAMDNAYSQFVSPASTIPVPAPPVAQAYCSANNYSPCDKTKFTSLPLPNKEHPEDVSSIVKNLYWPYGVKPTTGDFIMVNASLYQGILASAIGSTAASAAPSTDAQTANGWIFAGAYFYDFVKKSSTVATAMLPTFSEQPNLERGSTPDILHREAGVLIGEISASTPPPATGTGPSRWAHQNIDCDMPLLPIPLGSFCTDLLGTWMDDLSGSEGRNPVVSAQIFGSTLLSVISIVFPWLLLAASAVWILSSGLYVGTGIAAFGIIMEFLVLPILFFFAILFIGIGATLAVYTPMVPYMLFAFGAINWMVATIETMIAAPIVAIGLLYPEGQHELWGKAEHAINLILNIFLRPSLMIFGMISGMLLSYVTMTYINKGFMAVVASVEPNNMSFLEMIFFMILYTSIFTTVINKCFELIHVIPDKILRWIGGGAEQFGEGGAGVEKIGQGFQQGAGKVEGAAEGARGAAQSYGKARKEDKAAKSKPTEAGTGADTGKKDTGKKEADG